MSNENQRMWRDVAVVLFNLLTAIALALSAWALNGVVRLQVEIGTIKAKMPSEYPPRWFVEQYQRDQTDRKMTMDRLETRVEQNRQLLQELKRR